jgi:hypothetical protein
MNFDPAGCGGDGRQHRRLDGRYHIDPETDQPHIYVPDPLPDSVFVVTAYQLGPNALRALRRRRRRRR